MDGKKATVEVGKSSLDKLKNGGEAKPTTAEPRPPSLKYSWTTYRRYKGWHSLHQRPNTLQALEQPAGMTCARTGTCIVSAD